MSEDRSSKMLDSLVPKSLLKGLKQLDAYPKVCIRQPAELLGTRLLKDGIFSIYSRRPQTMSVSFRLFLNFQFCSLSILKSGKGE